jgi:hypothetical protein
MHYYNREYKTNITYICYFPTYTMLLLMMYYENVKSDRGLWYKESVITDACIQILHLKYLKYVHVNARWNSLYGKYI